MRGPSRRVFQPLALRRASISTKSAITPQNIASVSARGMAMRLSMMRRTPPAASSRQWARPLAKSQRNEGDAPSASDTLPRSARSGSFAAAAFALGLEPTMPARIVGRLSESDEVIWEVLEPARSMASKRSSTNSCLPARETLSIHSLKTLANQSLSRSGASAVARPPSATCQVMSSCCKMPVSLLRTTMGRTPGSKSLPMTLEVGMMRTTRLTHSAPGGMGWTSPQMPGPSKR